MDEPERLVYSGDDLRRIARDFYPDLPADMHPNLLLEKGVHALVAQGWWTDQKGMAPEGMGVEQLFVFVSQDPKK